MTLFKWMKFIFVVPFLWACVKADKHSSDLQNNLLKADLISVEKVEVRNIFADRDRKNSANFANHVTYFLKLCISDIASSGTLQGHSFKVSSELGNDRYISVSADSCLHWQEPISFDYLASAIDLEVNYKFHSAKNLGTLLKKVTFNPWNQARGYERGFVDQTNYSTTSEGNIVVRGKEEINRALNGKSERGVEAGSELALSDISIFPTEREKKKREDLEKFLNSREQKDADARRTLEKYIKNIDGLHFDLNMRMSPIVWVNNINGGRDSLPVNKGRFTVFANIVATNSDKNGARYILNQDLSKLLSSTVWNIDNDGRLNVSLPLVLRSESNYGNLTLALKVVPHDLGSNVKPFSAVYKLGTYADFASSQSGFKDFSCCSDKNQDGKQSYDEYLKTAANYKEFSEGYEGGLGINGIATLRPSEQFLFQELKVLYSRALPNETATDKTVQYTASTCIINRMTGTSIGMGSQFKVTTVDNDKKLELIVKTNQEGCLNWYGLISYKYYEKESYIKKTATIEYLDNKKEKPVVVSLDYFINPWDEKFTFGRDARNFTKEMIADVEAQQRQAPPSRFFLSDFNYTTLGFRYEIDKYMNLKVKKSVMLTLHPHVLKYNSIVAGRNGTFALKDGIYLLKVALQKYYLDPAEKGVRLGTDQQSNSKYAPTLSKVGNEDLKKKQYISSQTVLVRVLNGMINAPVEFEIDDLRLMRIRNQFFIQLQTIDEHRLKLAYQLDNKLKTKLGDIPNFKSEQEEKLSLAYDKLSKIEVLNAEIDKLYASNPSSVDLKKLAEKKDLLSTELGKALGISDSNKEKFANLVSYINKFRSSGANEQSAMRNHRRQVIDHILRTYKDKFAKLTSDKKLVYDSIVQDLSQKLANQSKLSESERKSLPALEDIDPMQIYFHLTTSESERNEESYRKALADIFGSDESSITEGQDFAVQSLQPTYNFDLLTNDDPKSDDFSGLARRTFMGPVTFLLNGNGSPVRPTDILNESVCPTSSCATVNRIEKSIVATHEQGGIPIDNLGQSNFRDTLSPSDIHDSYKKMTDIFGSLLNNKMQVYDYADSVNKNYESNPYYGSASGFLGISVDDLIEEERKIKKYQGLRQYLSSQVGNFLGAQNLKYVALNDDVSRVGSVDSECMKNLTDFKDVVSCIKKDPNLIISSKALNESLNSGLTKRFKLTPYWSVLNSWTRADIQFDKTRWKKIIENGNGIKQFPAGEQYKMLEKLCGALVDNFYSQEVISLAKAEGKILDFNNHVKDMYANCAEYAQNYVEAQQDIDNKEISHYVTYPAVVFERKLRIYNTTKRYMYKEGKSLNINIGANFSLSHSDGFGTSTGISAGLRPIELLEEMLPKYLRSKYFAKYGSNKKGKALAEQKSKNARENVKLGASPLSLNLTTGLSTGESLTRSDGTSVSEGTFLVGQIATLDIEIGKYEKCVITRLSPFILKQMHDELIEKLSNGGYIYEQTNADKIQAAFEKSNSGLMVCTGEVETKPLPVKERYYYFTQHFTEGDMLDSGDLFNHPWLLQMRGVRDYRTFVGTIRATKNKFLDDSSTVNRIYEGTKEAIMSNVSEMMTSGNQKASWEIVKSDQFAWPLEMLGEIYFNVNPTYPGMYTFIDDPAEKVSDWPYGDSDPKVSFEEHNSQPE